VLHGEEEVEIMLRKGMKLAVGIALVAALLAVSPAAGAEPRPHERTVAFVARDVVVLWSRAWQWVESLWGKRGACIDPNGSPCAGSSTGDAGVCIDPNGLCAQSPAKNGACINPDGAPCAASSTTNSGPGDPDG
jgi:hypothetical protein